MIRYRKDSNEAQLLLHATSPVRDPANTLPSCALADGVLRWEEHMDVSSLVQTGREDSLVPPPFAWLLLFGGTYSRQ